MKRFALGLFVVTVAFHALPLPGAVGDVWEATGWTATGYTSNTLMLQPETYYQVKISAHAQVAGKTVEWTIDTSAPGGGATGCLNVDGTLDLGSLTFAFAGFDDAVREPRDYEIVRAAELTGMLPADPGKHWRLTKRGNAVWLSWAKAGAVLIYR